MLEYKLRPPSLPACFDRTDLVRRALAGRLVLLAAPAGHGKTCLAAQVGAAGGGPTAWFTADELDRDAGTLVAQLLAALTRAWPDLGDASPSITDEDAALPLLAATLQTLAGPGCVVIDDAHLTDPGLLDAIVGDRHGQCTRSMPPRRLHSRKHDPGDGSCRGRRIRCSSRRQRLGLHRRGVCDRDGTQRR